MADENQTTQDKQEALRQITQAVMGLLDAWELNTEQMQAMLMLPNDVRARAFQKYRDGREVLPDSPDTLRRANYLLRIADALRTTYPCNPRMSGRWVKQPHRRFGRRTPLSIILNGGEGGLVAVLSELDCTFSWDLTGSKNTSCGPA
jgi:hypothetical protein